MNPFLRMSILYLGLYQAPKLALYRPSSTVALGVPNFEDDLNTFLIECVNIDPYALVEESVHDFQWILIPLLLC